MKLRNLKISIESEKEHKKILVRKLKEIEKGKAKDLGQNKLSFPDFKTFRRVFTLRRLEIIKAIKSKKPKSIYELAKFLNKKVENIYNDVALLENMGLIELEKSKEVRERVKPEINFDKMVIGMEV